MFWGKFAYSWILDLLTFTNSEYKPLAIKSNTLIQGQPFSWNQQMDIVYVIHYF